MDVVTTVDANVAIRAILDEDERAVSWFEARVAERARILSPDLWRPEAISAVRRMVAAGTQPSRDLDQLLDDLFALPVALVPTDRELAMAALRWAGRLGQSRAYDALYLAVAERHDAPLVTADDRLLDRCRQLGIDFVQGLPDDAG